MRRLRAAAGTGTEREGRSARRGIRAALGAAVLTALSALVVALTACGTTAGGVRVEGAPTDSAAPRSASSDGTTARPDGPRDSGPEAEAEPKAEPKPEVVGRGTAAYSESGEVREVSETEVISVIKRDPKVSSHVKRGLKPCVGDQYPVGMDYARATRGRQADLVVNVTSCSDSVGVGAYVYRRSTNGALVNVFAAERPPVWATFRDGMLEVTRDVYVGDEPLCCPSGRDVITYAWQDGVFHEVGRERSEDDDGVDGGGSGGSDSTPAPPAPAATERKE
ncbi:hypothetical protein DVA86_29575 [Streptomyces armeniacus]|uniref:Lipoprotein CseA n=1 Tax=Streptomyces armeniacus TaxID=83291 RepID=A0A345XWW1_9ACTN|nr:hypothetical protein [Streptomyces armeniacus]AXK36127.1 hypothetical protein DVA86_29575 [Streptomyces armeniacus]